jgi:hypothetical protein
MIRFVNADEPARKVARPAVTPTLVDEIARVTKNIARDGFSGHHQRFLFRAGHTNAKLLNTLQDADP